MNSKKLEELLPFGYEQACYETKAIERKKKIKNPLDLLILIIYYLSGDKSLIDVSIFARMRGIEISDVGFLKKFVKCKKWIVWLTAHILPKPIIQYEKPEWLKNRQVLAIDASDITEKGATKRLWHLHYAVNLFTLTCDQFKITEQATGESLLNFSLAKGTLVLADRAYGTIKSIEHALRSGADFILRLRYKAFDLYDTDGNKIILLDWLKTIGDQAASLRVYIKGSDKTMRSLRICAIRKSKEAIAASTSRQKRLQVRKQKKLHDDTLEAHNYVFMITSLPDAVSAEDVLSCYRLRWQVEMVFKRLKSLLQLGNIPTKTMESGEVWINGKILLALLNEKYLGNIDFSPSEELCHAAEHLERD